MESPNLSKKTPINISLFYPVITNDIFNDHRFNSLLNVLIKLDDTASPYTYALYSDASVLTSNIYIPIFHTIYLGCTTNNVVIANDKDLWLLNTYSHNHYYIFDDEKDTFDYSSYKITKINHLTKIK